MHATIETITPERAAEYLLVNTSNRPCSASRVYDLSSAMRRGEWVTNGDAIRFAKDGTLLDGQGRLKACVMAKMPFQTLVARGLDSAAFMTIDLGKKRSTADLFAISGEKNTVRLAAAVRFLLIYESGTYTGRNYTPKQLSECLGRHPGIRFWIGAPRSLYQITRSAVTVICVAYLGSLTRPQASETFLGLVTDGVGLDRGSPILALRDRLQQDRAAHSKLPAGYVAQLVIHAYNAFARGETRSLLKGNRNSADLPRVIA